MDGLNDILKGSMNATNVTLSGSLTPEQSHNFIDVIKQNNGFLQKIHTEKMGRLTKELDAWDVAKGILVRVASGEKSNDSQRSALSKVGAKLDAKSVQLFARILQDALEDNKSNPNFEKETFDAFAKAFGNDLALLGFTGESDTYDGTFKTLHKGWLQVVKDSSDAVKLTYTATEKVSNRLSALNLPLHLVQGGANQILGIPFEITPLMPKGVYLATTLKNLVLGVVLDIRSNHWYDAEERALKYVFDVFTDYEVVVKKWASLMSKA
ncbi:P2 family phage major capsid protein [Campylobacter concisus]|uniref:P2 family phage major capsid protein n=1 Tax=Campylobacter concisus TaxID=199 RepID=UPI00112FB09C|nr:P2 family phage major capsid protein [Campylobacter concisus]